MRRAKAAGLSARRAQDREKKPAPRIRRADGPRETQLCPHPYKRGYSTILQAQIADPASFENPIFNLYRCRCGAFHYGHATPKGK